MSNPNGRITLEYSPEEMKVTQSLIDAGLLKSVKPRCNVQTVDFMPVTIVGRPLSETIVDERR